jgi:ribosomal protein L7Ae-like RNA K-turn-binding protein
MDSQKVINLLTICRKAGKLVTGFDISLENVIARKSSYILLASDVSPKTTKEVHYQLNNEGLESKVSVLTLPLTMEDVANYIGIRAGVIAICDKGFGKSFEKLLVD